MGMYSNIVQEIEAVFGSAEWQALGINTLPSNIKPPSDIEPEFLRLEILPGNPRTTQYGGGAQVNGYIIVQIYIAVNTGTRRVYEIGDILDGFLLKQNFKFNLQTAESTLNIMGNDPDNPTLFRGDYSVRFNSF